MNWRRFWGVFVSAVAAMAIVLSGCAKEATVSDKPVVGGIYSLALGEEPKTLNPFKAASAAESIVLSQITSPLVNVDFEGKFAPGLAKEWKTSEDGKTWTFKLRDDVYFHCGEKMTAKDLVWTWTKAIKEPGPMMTEYFSGVESVEAPDDYTLVVKFKEPNGAFLTQLRSGAMTGPYCHTCYEKLGADGFAKKPCGVGPYKMEDWKTGQSITLVRNDKYKWGPSWVHAGPAYIERICYKIIVDQATRLAALETGELTATGIPGQFWSKYENDERFYRLKGLANFEAYLLLNMSKAPFDDLKVRQAIGYAIDRPAIVATVLEGRGRPAYSPIHPKLPGYDSKWETQGFLFNKDKAKALLDEAGWKDTDNDGIREKNGKKLNIDLWTMPGTVWGGAADAIKTNLKDVGVNAEITSYEIGTLMQYMSENKHQAAVFGWTWDGDPLQILKMVFHSSQTGGGLNYSMYKDPAMDKLIDDGRKEMDQNKRLEAVKAIQQKAFDDAVYIPVFYQETLTVVSKQLQGVKIHPFFADLILHDAWLAPAQPKK